MRSTLFLALAGAAVAQNGTTTNSTTSSSSNSTDPADQITTNIATISRLWGQVSVYADNNETFFGVNDTGIPSGCQVEQVHLLQRHAQRFPTGGDDDGGNDARFAQKLTNFTSANPNAAFTGPLAFLNTYQYIMSTSLLTGIGAVTEFQAGVTFWNRYGRILTNATTGQLSWNSSTSPKPTLRTTSQSRIWNSALNWALGFFGTTFTATPNANLTGLTTPYNLVIIPEGGTENNTLASYDSCPQSDDDIIGYLGDDILFTYLPLYLANATARMNQYAPQGFTFNYNDTYAMQSICAYESNYVGLGTSPFCNLFTLNEWYGFEQTLNIEYYYDYSFGNPTGRAQGIGYLQELIARLQNQYITTSDSSVNSTYDNNNTTFPLNQTLYADFSHDDIIVSVLTALSMEYFHQPPNITAVPPTFGTFQLNTMTPFGGRLVTEVIGCSAANPTAVQSRYQYRATEYGYNANNATHKFIRMRLNNGILPLDTVPGCDNSRTDGMCGISYFLAGQMNSDALANYQYACFGNYTLDDPLSGYDYDGTIFA